MLDLLARHAVARVGSNRLQIYMFHRVQLKRDPLFPGEVTAAEFDRICHWIAAWHIVMPLDQAAQALAVGTLPPGAACITFDDGYADNHDVALPILLKHRLCATFFVATGYLNGGRMWNDTVIEAARSTALEQVEISEFGLSTQQPLSLKTAEQRRVAIDVFLKAVKHLSPEQRQVSVDSWAARLKGNLPTNLMMTHEQVVSLSASGMQIGAHTVSHPILACTSAEHSIREMVESKAHLEALLDKPVTLFAYPNGAPGKDYSLRDVELVRSAGFEAAVSTAWGAAQPGDDLFQLPRFTPWDRDRARFGLRLLRNLTSGRALRAS